MDKHTARTLVKHTFQNAFDKERFVHFIKELLNHFDEASFVYRGNYIRDSYKPFIQSLERVGKYEDSEGNKLDILIVQLKKGSSLERARTMQRNFIAWYLNGSRGGKRKDAALVAFVSPDPADWRFSLVTMEYKLTETPKGTVKAQAEYTPARRFSFLVGEHESSHTAQDSLVPIIEDDAHDPTLKQLKEAFNIEKATKEFFKKYRNLFSDVVEALEELLAKDADIKADFESKGVIVADFAKKLLGQIVFLYFLQKKGWFGVKRHQEWGSGSKGFLRELFAKKHGDYQNFFNNILEPLFYEALSQEHRGDYYSRFDCRIPFLNGGLFDPLNDYDWIETDILLPNELFSNTAKTKEGDIGTGILDIFDRYNFTVNEDEPLEKEVAVDPEMLGKVFENLLEVKDRKSKGTYYTPREIVHYMCQESLINYLATELEGKASKEELEDFIRHGERFTEHEAAVLIKEQMIKEGKQKASRYESMLPKTIKDNAKLIDEKLETIRICDPAVGSGAFPVGMMSEIIRARGALPFPISESKERTPYNFKRHAIQECLYGVDIDPGAIEIAKLRLWLSLVVDEVERSTIQPLPNLDYKLVCGDSLLGVEIDLFNSEQFLKMEKLIPLHLNETNVRKKLKYKAEIDELILNLSGGHKQFEFKIYFSNVFHEKGGFDVVIANPPYVRVDNIYRSLKNFYKQNFRSAVGKYDLYYLFFEQSFSISNPKGVCVFISPNKWCAAASASVLRHILFDDTQSGEIISVSRIRVFSEAANYPVVSILNKSDRNHQSYLVRQVDKLSQLVDSDSPQKYQADRKDIVSLPNYVVPINISQSNFSLVRRLYENQSKLSDLISVSEGLRIPTKLESVARKEHAIVKQFQFSRYTAISDGSFIGQAELRTILSESTDRFKKTFRNKLLIAEDGLQINATLDLDNHIPQGGVYFATTTQNELSLLYLLGILNSKLMSFVYQSLYSGMHMGGGYLRYRTKFLERLPRPKHVCEIKTKRIEESVNKILELKIDKNLLKEAATLDDSCIFEQEIDQLVYKLYGLTPEEIKIVEGGS